MTLSQKFKRAFDFVRCTKPKLTRFAVIVLHDGRMVKKTYEIR